MKFLLVFIIHVLFEMLIKNFLQVSQVVEGGGGGSLGKFFGKTVCNN